MIRLAWLVATAFGFMVAGALFAYGEFKVGFAFAAVTWVWMAFPKITVWALEKVIRVIRKGASHGEKAA